MTPCGPARRRTGGREGRRRVLLARRGRRGRSRAGMRTGGASGRTVTSDARPPATSSIEAGSMAIHAAVSHRLPPDAWLSRLGGGQREPIARHAAWTVTREMTHRDAYPKPGSHGGPARPQRQRAIVPVAQEAALLLHATTARLAARPFGERSPRVRCGVNPTSDPGRMPGAASSAAPAVHGRPLRPAHGRVSHQQD
jgi:hypothetical protein